MNVHQQNELWTQLANAGLVEGTLPEAAAPAQAWYIRAMLIFSGWFAAVFLLLFLGFLSIAIFDKPSLALVLGILIIVGAYALMRHGGDGDFLQQLSLATALAGETLFLYGLARIINGNITSFWIQMAGVEVILLFLMPSYIHRVVCTLALATAVTGLLYEMHALQLSTAIAALSFVALWLNERKWAGRHSTLEPVAVGTALVLTLWDMPALARNAETARLLYGSGQIATAHIGLALQAAAWLALCLGLLKRASISASSTAGIGVLLVATGASALAWWAPGFLPALMVLAVGFGSGHRFLFGLGLLALVMFLSGYYYNLEATLLIKSLVLAISGAALVGLRFLLVRSGGTDHA